MERLSFEEFLRQETRAAYDAAVFATPAISRFCTTTSWIVPALREIHERDPEEPEFEPLIVREGDSWLVFDERRPEYFYPFESAWMFACPLVGGGAAELLARAREEYLGSEPRGFVVGGVARDGALHRTLREWPGSLHYEDFPATDCMTIDLGGGVDTWLERRSRRFRRTLQLAKRRCSGVVEIEDVPPDLERILAIQRRTRKWETGADIFQADDCLRFYRRLIEESPEVLRLRIARIGGEDAAYLLGAVAGDTFRGLQMSYAETHRALGLGNHLQADTMRHVAGAEGIRIYDLGMHSEYKERWADERKEFVGCFLVL